MKIVTYNIKFGLGKDGRFDLERIASEVDGADIIALQEVERHWQRSGNDDQPTSSGQPRRLRLRRNTVQEFRESG